MLDHKSEDDLSREFEVGNYKIIYAFSRSDTPKLQGMLKVGDTQISTRDPKSLTKRQLEEAAMNRISAYTKTALVDIVLEYVELALIEEDNGELRTFRDHDVHRVLQLSGYEKFKDSNNSGQEWFKDISVADVKAAVEAVKEGYSYFDSNDSLDDFELYPHQRAAVNKTLITLDGGTVESPRRMLWNAKMRFGKTIAAYSYAQEADLSRVLVITHRPDVNASWFEDFKKLQMPKKNWNYGSKRNGDSLANMLTVDSFGKTVPKEGKILWFASIQDLRLSKNSDSDELKKNNELFAVDWDLIITDEAHEGTLTELANSMYESLKSARYLDLSGTPFNIGQAANWDFEGAHRYLYDGTFVWSYPDEQKAKREWDENNPGEPNPWGDFPSIEFRTYNIGELLGKVKEGAYPTVDLNDLFAVGSDKKFVRELEVKDFLLKLLGSRRYSTVLPESFPFHEDYQDQFAHTLWMLPSVAAVGAMEALLKESSSGFSGWTIVNATGEGNSTVDKEDPDALKRVKKAVKTNRSITLSFRMLTTGISVPEWTAVFMMSNISNPMSYMQAAFRSTTPGALPNGSQKTKAYVFDFNADRCLKAIAELAKVSAKTSKDPLEQSKFDQESINDYLEYVSLLSLEGAHFVAPDSESIMEKLNEAYLDEVIEKGFDSPKIFNFRELRNFSISEKVVLDTMRKLQGGSLPGSVGDIVISEKSEEQREKELKELKELQDKAKESAKEKLPEPDKSRLKELTESEANEKKIEAKNRQNGVKIVTGIACRLPMLVFASNPEDKITPQNFHLLIDDKSWEEFMPVGLHRIKPEGTASLEDRADEALGKDSGVVYWEDAARFFDPVIFSMACERIRQLARLADEKGPLERAFRIAALFSTFKNPDKETVLTPWRVVNLQYGSTVGGLVFIDLEKSDSTNVYGLLEDVATGEKKSYLIPEAIQLLDNETHRVAPVWFSKPLSVNPSAVNEEDTVRLDVDNNGTQTDVGELWDRSDLSVYDINSKTALYPLFAAASIYYRKSQEAGADPVASDIESLESSRKVWRNAVENHVFLNCRVDYSRSIAQRVLMGYDNSVSVNATVVDILSMKQAIEWWNSGASAKNSAGKKLSSKLMPDWWKARKNVNKDIGAILRLASNLPEKRLTDQLELQMLKWQKSRKTWLPVAAQADILIKQIQEETTESMDVPTEEKPLNGQTVAQHNKMLALRKLFNLVDKVKELPEFTLTAGNPPYQAETAQKETTGQKTVRNVFQEFQEVAIELSIMTSMVYPGGRWMQLSGKGLKSFGESMMSSKHLVSIDTYQNGDGVSDSEKLFAGVRIPDGLAIVFYDSLYNNSGSILLDKSAVPVVKVGDIMPSISKELLDVFNLIKSFTEDGRSRTLSNRVSARSLYSIESDFAEKNADKVFSCKTHISAPSELNDPIKIFTNNIAGKGGNPEWFWINRSEIPTNKNLIDRYQVTVSSAAPNSEIFTMVPAGAAHGRSRLSLASFATEDEANNFLKYIKTALIRASFRFSQNGGLSNLARFVPDIEDYSNANELFAGDPSIEELNERLHQYFINFNRITEPSYSIL